MAGKSSKDCVAATAESAKKISPIRSNAFFPVMSHLGVAMLENADKLLYGEGEPFVTSISTVPTSTEVLSGD